MKALCELLTNQVCVLVRYDDPAVIAGQGTVALEVCEQMEEKNMKLDAVVIPVGGGGLLAGMAVTLKELVEECEVIVSH